jgi:Cu+-exporting ATPase
MEVSIGVYGMTCGHCQKRVADAIVSLDGVESVDVNLEAESATVNFDPEKLSLDDIKEAVRKAGYSAEREAESEEGIKAETPEALREETPSGPISDPDLCL